MGGFFVGGFLGRTYPRFSTTCYGTIGVGENGIFLHRCHPLWVALGIKGGDVDLSFFQDVADWNAGRHTLVTKLDNDGSRHFIQHALCEF